MGTPVAEDIVLASAQKYPELDIQSSELPMVYVFRDCPYIFLGIETVENNGTLFYVPKTELKDNKINWKPLTNKTDEVWDFYLHGKDIYLFSAKGNPKFRIIKTEPDNPDLKSGNPFLKATTNGKFPVVI